MNEVFLATRNFLRGEEGVTMIEYALIAALIAVAVIVILTAVGTQLNVIFTRIRDCLIGPTNGTCGG